MRTPEEKLNIEKFFNTSLQTKLNFKEKITQIFQKKSEDELQIEGMRDFLIKSANCCSPLPGDGVFGVITKGQGISIHLKDCKNLYQEKIKTNLFVVCLYLELSSFSFFFF